MSMLVVAEKLQSRLSIHIAASWIAIISAWLIVVTVPRGIADWTSIFDSW